jgi:hypothetical protein
MDEYKRVKSQSINSILLKLLRTTMKSAVKNYFQFHLNLNPILIFLIDILLFPYTQIACLLVLAVAAQAQFFGYGGYYGNYGAAYPFAAGLRATTAYTGIPATASTYPVAYGYPSYTATQYHAQDELGQASFGYTLTPDRPPATSVTGSATRSAATLTSIRKARKSVSPTPPTPEASTSNPTTCPSLPSTIR